MVYLYNIRGISPWDVHGGEEDKKKMEFIIIILKREKEREREEKNKESNALSG